MDTPSRACSGCGLRNDVSRRDFLSLAAASAATVLLAGCGGTSGPTSLGTGTVAITLASFPALATVGSTVRVKTSPALAISRVAAGNAGLVAFSLACTHEGTTVGINSNNTLTCPNHGAQFTSAGVWSGGFRTSNLVRLPVTVDDTGATATITLG